MKILSMTATFGKLDGQTITFGQDLNVICAPNEWGKSTWCAFLLAMLYGVDTKERTSKDVFAVKDRYKPWSGAEMSGRMDLLWEDRAITIERSSKGRVPMGVFRAYETQTGIPVDGLTGDNCGQMLLGVEKSVFMRAGFLRLTDMPVTQDDALRRRLNALVTTGDESGAADDLMQKLKDLKNSCRHNKTGELPKAEAAKAQLEQKLSQLEDLKNQSSRIQQRQAQVKEDLAVLENHMAALHYAAAQEASNRVVQAENACCQAQQQLQQAADACKNLPPKANVQEDLRKLEQLSLQQATLAGETLPPQPNAPTAPSVYAGLTAPEAAEQARSDKAAYDMLCKPVTPILLIISLFALLAGAVLLFFSVAAAIGLLVVGIILLFVYFQNKSKQKKECAAIAARYQGVDSSLWVSIAMQYLDDTNSFSHKQAAYIALQEDLTRRKTALQAQIDALTQGKTVAETTAYFADILTRYQALSQAEEAYRQAKLRTEELGSLVTKVDPPACPDTLTCTKEQTQQQMIALQAELQQLQRNSGLCQGQMNALGQADALQKELDQLNTRIEKLESYYAAIELAMQTLTQTTTELQRRFAPQIAGRAQELFARLTDGRYDRLQLTQELSLETAATGENTLSNSRSRSDGTIDQLYLALRLAVAEALTPAAPLVLDDAFVRFDEARLAKAMELVKEISREKQVILFTCQKREETYL